MPSDSLIPKHGGYRKLKSFQIAQLAYDITVRFCDRYIDKRSRTHDQMVQAARSGVQNIAEGSEASATSKKSEMKLTQVARASLEELRLDYEDFLRHRSLSQWATDDPRRAALVAYRFTTADAVAGWVRDVHDRERSRAGVGDGHGPDGQHGQKTKQTTAAPTANTGYSQSIKSTESILSKPSTYPELAANAALVLIGVACSLLDRQIAAQASAFQNEGGFTERLYRVRTAHRNNAPPQ
ncbi:MAG: four helix bundle suffix domain-containing protein [Verrucomicrobiota bacterium]|nr:four helix bundle suffix domain-containing protein [Verrucomicrobiota bacterium]